MFGLTSVLVRGVFGRGRGEAALLGMPLIPAAAVLDLGRAGIGAVRKAMMQARRWGAKTLRSAAQAIDPAPVASPLLVRYARLSLPLVAAPEPVQPIRLMASAAQETTEQLNHVGGVGYHGNYLSPKAPDYRSLVKEHGSIAAAARHLGIPVSTLRGRIKRQG